MDIILSDRWYNYISATNTIKMRAPHKYEVKLQWDGERKGTLNTGVSPQSIEVATGSDFHKGIKGLWSPEHLYLATLTSCLMTTFLAIAENSNLIFCDFKCNAIATAENVNLSLEISDVIIKVTVCIPSSKTVQKALRIIAISEKHCVISNSVKTRIHIAPEVIVQ